MKSDLIPKIANRIEPGAILIRRNHGDGGGGSFYTVLSRSDKTVILKMMTCVHISGADQQTGVMEPGIPRDIRPPFRKRIYQVAILGDEFIVDGCAAFLWDGAPVPFWQD